MVVLVLAFGILVSFDEIYENSKRFRKRFLWTSPPERSVVASTSFLTILMSRVSQLVKKKKPKDTHQSSFDRKLNQKDPKPKAFCCCLLPALVPVRYVQLVPRLDDDDEELDPHAPAINNTALKERVPCEQ